mgnify:FL=1
MQYVSAARVYRHVTDAFWHVAGLEQQAHKHMDRELFRINTIASTGSKSELSAEFVIRQKIDFIERAQLKGRKDAMIIDLGEPDPNILPIKKEGR